MNPRVLYVTHRVPFPPDRGDRIRTWNILKFLATRADVDIACLADEPLADGNMSELKKTCRRVAVVPHSGLRRYVAGAASMLCGQTVTEGLFRSGALRRIIEAWNRDSVYDAVIASSSGVSSYILPVALKSGGQRWIDLIDVDSQKWLDYATASSFPMTAVYGCEGRRLRKLESRLAEQVDRLLVVTEAERALFKSFSPHAPIQAVGNGVDTCYFGPDSSSVVRHSCVFVGVMDYRPNVDAVCWFVENVWPQVLAGFPDAQFQIVGKSPAAEVQALNSVEGVTVTGPVPDVRPWLHQASCVVVPLRIARGVQNKVLEAMACARPVVCSPAPLQGLDVDPGLHLLSAESVDEWVDAVSTIFEDEYRAEELGVAANAWVQTNHRWSSCLAYVGDLLDPATEASSTTEEAFR